MWKDRSVRMTALFLESGLPQEVCTILCNDAGITAPSENSILYTRGVQSVQESVFSKTKYKT